MDIRRPDEPADTPLATRPYMPTPEQYVEALPTSGIDGISRPSRHRTPRRYPRRGTWSRVVASVLFLMVAGALGYIGYIAFNVAKISTKPLELTGLATDATGRVNVLVLGEGDPGHDGEGLTDTIMVMSMDTQAKRIAQISVPRDLRVNIPGYGYGKINEANADGGPGLAEQVVANTLGIPINYYVKTDFTGLRQMVDAVGGIDVNVKQRLRDPEYPCDADQYKVCGLDIEPGLQHMDGTRALEYARCRKGTCGDDFGRAARQQEVLNLVRDKIVKWNVLVDPSKLLPVVAAVRGSLETDMGSVQMLEFAKKWQDAKANNPISFVLSTSDGGLLRGDSASSDLLPVGGTFDAIQKRAQDIFSAQ